MSSPLPALATASNSTSNVPFTMPGGLPLAVTQVLAHAQASAQYTAASGSRPISLKRSRGEPVLVTTMDKWMESNSQATNLYNQVLTLNQQLANMKHILCLKDGQISVLQNTLNSTRAELYNTVHSTHVAELLAYSIHKSELEKQDQAFKQLYKNYTKNTNRLNQLEERFIEPVRTVIRSEDFFKNPLPTLSDHQTENTSESKTPKIYVPTEEKAEEGGNKATAHQ